MEQSAQIPGRAGRKHHQPTSRRAMVMAFGTLLAGLLAGAAPRLLNAGHSAGDAEYDGFSRASEVRELSFSQRGTVGETVVRAGDTVKVGQELVRLEDSVQRAQVRLAAISAGDTSAVDQAEATLKFREEELRIVTEANQKSSASSPADLREAKFRRDISAIEAGNARTKAKSDQVLLEREQARLDEMRILSPIGGTVVVVSKRGGEGVTEGTPVVTIVSVDPLWVDVSVQIKAAATLKVGQLAIAEWEDIDGVPAMPGKILYIAPAADARQINIRVEVPNPNHIPGGLHGKVRFPPTGPGAGQGTGSAASGSKTQ